MRYFVDDGAFADVGGAPNDWISSASGLTEVLTDLRTASEVVGIVSGWGTWQPWPGRDIASVLADGSVGRELGRRLLGLLDKCVKWDLADESAHVDEEVRCDGVSRTSYGIAYAAQRTASGLCSAAITTVAAELRGPVSVEAEGTTEQVVFVVDTADDAQFLREWCIRCAHDEAAFFSIVARAFPDLQFAENLRFNAFEGHFRDLLTPVVKHLAALNDHFVEAFRSERGLPGPISSRIGVDVSMEGSLRMSATRMRAFDVEYGAHTLRCEWHSKIEPHRNRIYFSPGGVETGGHVFIGMFARHL